MKFEFSAGGIVYKKEDSKLYILVSQHSQHKGWVFPKGLIGDRDEIKDGKKSASAKGFGETKEEAAVREVEEETGAKGEILKQLTPITFWYMWEGEKRKKTVYYFIMKFVGGDITEHDHEMQAVEWLLENEVLDRLTYKGDKDAYREALPQIQTLAK